VLGKVGFVKKNPKFGQEFIQLGYGISAFFSESLRFQKAGVFRKLAVLAGDYYVQVFFSPVRSAFSERGATKQGAGQQQVTAQRGANAEIDDFIFVSCTRVGGRGNRELGRNEKAYTAVQVVNGGSEASPAAGFRSARR
jgi:hypothetical protein